MKKEKNKAIEKSRKLRFDKPDLTGNLKSNYFRQGSYSTGMTVLVIAAVLVINLIVNELPAKYTKLDISTNKLYSIGEQTKELLGNLEDEVTLYFVCESGGEDAVLTTLLEQYEAESKHIQVVTKDPVLNPSFASQYTDSDISNNSIIVESGGRSKVISYSDVYEYDIDYTTYSYQATGFDGEGQITSAIDYVTSENIPILYTLEGHGEAELSTDMENLVAKQNIEVQSLSLMAEERVPEDASCLMIFSPTADLTDIELESILEYAENGGTLLIVTAYTGQEMPNMETLLAQYGVKTTEGVVSEQNTAYYYQGYPMYLLPAIGSHTITSNIGSGRYALVPIAQGIEVIDEEDDSVTIRSLLTTSDDAISKTDVENAETYEKEAGDLDGPFNVGVAVEKTFGLTEAEESEGDETTETVESKLVYFSSEAMFDSNIDAAVSNTNSELLTGSLGWMCEQETVVSIAAKSLEYDTIVFTSAQIGKIGFAVTAFIPLAILISGGVVWFRRRKK